MVGSSVVERPRRHRARWLAGGAVVVTGALATAAAASGVLGGPAPDPIRAHLAALDAGMPQDLRLNPDVEHAMAVASTESGVLYAADLKDGGYCIEVATEGDKPRGAACVTAAQLGDRAIEVTAPIPSGPAAALLVGGRINDERVERVVVRYSDGTSNDVVLGLARYWLVEVPDSVHAIALTDGVEVAGVDADGLDVSTLGVPPLRDEDPDGTAHDNAQPVFVSTISTGDDLTLVLGVEGSVNVGRSHDARAGLPRWHGRGNRVGIRWFVSIHDPARSAERLRNVIGQARRTGRQRSRSLPRRRSRRSPTHNEIRDEKQTTTVRNEHSN